MKILHAIASIDPRSGGPIEGTNQINAQLITLGHHIEMVSLDSPDAISHNLPIPVHGLGPASGKYGYTQQLLPWLRKNTTRFDAVIINGIWQYHSVATWKALTDSKIPYFVFPHGMLDPWFKHTYPLKHLKKWLYWPWAEYRVLRDARAVIFTCEEERLLARQSFWLYKCNEVVANYCAAQPPNNVPELKSIFFKEFPQLRNKRLLLFLSRIHEKKGCDILIKAFSTIAEQNPSLHLVMAGPDQTGLIGKLNIHAQELGILDRITFTGMLQGDMKWGAFYAAEVFILPSHQENFGIVVAEALACGKPVLISNKINIWREITKDKAGFIDEDTIEGTKQNLKRWLTMNKQAYDEMSKQAIVCFENRFQAKKAAERLLEIIGEG